MLSVPKAASPFECLCLQHAGIDLAAPVNALQQASDDPEDVEVNPVRAMNDFTRPIIGAINGAAVTGGFELALACDILIGSERARFQDTHCSVGVVPCWGLSQKLSRTVGPVRARLASLTASSIDARTAEQWGILARVVLDADDTVGGGSGGSRSGGRGGAGALRCSWSKLRPFDERASTAGVRAALDTRCDRDHGLDACRISGLDA